MKLYRGWARNGEKHMLFETMKENLKIGDQLFSCGENWIVEIIF